jgi:hypothetical protein
MTTMSDYAPSIKAARLFEKTSAKGNMYLVGRWGALKVAIIKTKDTGDNGEPIWSLMLSEAPARTDAPAASTAPADSSEKSKHDRQSPSGADADAATSKPADLNDTIPF